MLKKFRRKEEGRKGLFSSCKKGTVLDLLPVMVALLTLAVSLIVGYAMYDQIAPSINNTGTPQQVTANTYNQFGIWDNLWLAALIGLSLTSVIAAARVRISPLFFFLSIILLAIILVIGGVMSITWDSIQSNPQFDGQEFVFPKMFLIMDNFMYYLLIVGALIVIALYSTRGQNLL